ncbi:hypothetical protein [Variovorax sp. GT1P44]|uniref:hypothetical protein n=1 Tax=Variovorax sp. GT1P44 TaxID=3443742 RepID=UPI003F461587
MDSMNMPVSLRTGLEDLTGEMVHARRNSDVGRLALLCWCEIRHWARRAGEERLAHLSCALITDGPASDRREFLARVDQLISELEDVCERAGIHAATRSLELARLDRSDAQRVSMTH